MYVDCVFSYLLTFLLCIFLLGRHDENTELETLKETAWIKSKLQDIISIGRSRIEFLLKEKMRLYNYFY